MEFNELGGVTLKENYPVEKVSKIRVIAQKGRTAELYEGQHVAWDNGVISADTVTIGNYDDSYFKARDIASLIQRYNFKDDVVGGLITEMTAAGLERVETAYGSYKTLRVSEFKPSMYTEETLYLDLSIGGKPVRIVNPERVADIKYNSLGIGEESTLFNLQGEVVERSISHLDAQGRPEQVVDEDGKVLIGYIGRNVINRDMGTVKLVIQALWNGLIYKTMLSPSKELIDAGVVWWTAVNYDAIENEIRTVTYAYHGTLKLGEVKHTTTLDLGEAKLYKEEVNALNVRQTYEQNAYTGSENNIEIHTTLNGAPYSLRAERTYDSKGIIQSYIMYAQDNPALWVMKAEQTGINKEEGKVSFDYTWANGRKETVQMDALTGLTTDIKQDIKYSANGETTWTTDIAYDALGLETKRLTFAAGDRNKVVMEASRRRIDRANNLLVVNYSKPTGEAGAMTLNPALGIAETTTVEDVDLGRGLYENYTSKMTYDQQLRETSRVLLTSRGETAMKSWVDSFDVKTGDENAGRNRVYFAKASGEEGEMEIDTNSGLVKRIVLENAEVAPGVIDTRTTDIDYSLTGIFEHSVTRSWALDKAVFESRRADNSVTGLEQVMTDHLKGGLEMTETFNVMGMKRGTESKKWHTTTNYLRTGLENDSTVVDKRTGKTIITSDYTHSFTAKFDMEPNPWAES